MKVQSLGTGCARCKPLTANAEQAIRELGLDVQVEKVEDPRELVRFRIMSTPGLAVDGEVKATGKVLSPETIKRLLVG